MHEPYTYLNGLQSQDLEDLLEDIKVRPELFRNTKCIIRQYRTSHGDFVQLQVYKELENNANVSYWEDVATIVRDELGKLRRLKAPAPARDGVHRAVADDVTQVLRAAAGASTQA